MRASTIGHLGEGVEGVECQECLVCGLTFPEIWDNLVFQVGLACGGKSKICEIPSLPLPETKTPTSSAAPAETPGQASSKSAFNVGIPSYLSHALTTYLGTCHC